MSIAMEGSDLQNALENHLPYSLLPPFLRQRMSEQDYVVRAIHYAILRCQAYHRLPEHVRLVKTEKEYYEEMIRYGGQQMQLYPYAHQKSVVLYTRETPLIYYTRMVSELLKSENSYDRLPNFTAMDILYLLGIGRNQYLNLTKEVRSKLRWHINRNFVPEHLPSAYIESVSLDPLWKVEVIDQSPDTVRKLSPHLSPNAVLLLKFLLTKGATQNAQESFSSLEIKPKCLLNEVHYVCEFPKEPLLELYRYGLIYLSFNITPDDYITIPPLGNFVMNRTSDEPQEVLLYRVLSTVDERTPISLLAQLLMLSDEDVCASVSILIRLRLAYLKNVKIPEKILQDAEMIVHNSWMSEYSDLVTRNGTNALSASANPSEALSSPKGLHQQLQQELTSGKGATAGGHREKRIAFLYDSTLTGFLMMTNLSRNPSFKQNAVTLFEVGKMPNETVGSFLELLDTIDLAEVHSFGGEAQKYINSALCLRQVLRTLKSLSGPDGESGSVDMLKIESLNELEATTRYSLLGRNFWAYVISSPASCAPLIDMELSGVYGSTVSLMMSPWFLLFVYSKTRRGPLSLLVPFGAQLYSWPPDFFELEENHRVRSNSEQYFSDLTRDGVSVVGGVAKMRVQAMTLDAQVSYIDLDHSLLLLNEMAETAPIFAQCYTVSPLVINKAEKEGNNANAVTEIKEQKVVEMSMPFNISEQGINEMVSEKIGTTDFRDEKNQIYSILQEAISAIHVEYSLGYFVLNLTLWRQRPCSNSNGTADIANSEADAPSLGPSTWFLQSCYVVDVGLGVPLTDQGCCTRLVEQIPSLLTADNMDKHNLNMRACVSEFSEFLESYTTLTRQVHESMAIQSTSASGPMTQLHLRKTGENSGAPYPSTIVFFNGKELQVIDDLNPLVEIW